MDLLAQPSVATDPGEVIARMLGPFAALIRWQHARHGLLLPGRCLTTAAETALDIEIGDCVLADVCRRSAAISICGSSPRAWRPSASARPCWHWAAATVWAGCSAGRCRWTDTACRETLIHSALPTGRDARPFFELPKPSQNGAKR